MRWTLSLTRRDLWVYGVTLAVFTAIESADAAGIIAGDDFIMPSGRFFSKWVFSFAGIGASVAPSFWERRARNRHLLSAGIVGLICGLGRRQPPEAPPTCSCDGELPMSAWRRNLGAVVDESSFTSPRRTRRCGFCPSSYRSWCSGAQQLCLPVSRIASRFRDQLSRLQTCP